MVHKVKKKKTISAQNSQHPSSLWLEYIASEICSSYQFNINSYQVPATELIHSCPFYSKIIFLE